MTQAGAGLVWRRETRYANRMQSSVRSLVKNAMLDRIPGVLRRGPATVNRVALTFDDGPDHMTEQYLDVLDRLGVAATFFLVGENVATRPALMREYIRRGHQVAGHGYDHTRFSELGHDALLEQCARTEQALGAHLTGLPWVRPPHGTLDARSVFGLIAGGYTIAMWSFDTRDYGTKDPAELVERCAAVTAGDVMLMHEGQSWTLEALPGIVKTLRAKGLELVTMQDLFAK